MSQQQELPFSSDEEVQTNFDKRCREAKPGEVVVVPPGARVGDPVHAVQRPSIGRIVIYHDRITGQKSPAIVQFADHDNSINCHVMPDNGMPFGAQRVPYAKGFGDLYAWSWPERT